MVSIGKAFTSNPNRWGIKIMIKIMIKSVYQNDQMAEGWQGASVRACRRLTGTKGRRDGRALPVKRQLVTLYRIEIKIKIKIMSKNKIKGIEAEEEH